MVPHTLEVVLFKSSFHLFSNPMRFLRSANDVISLVSSLIASKELMAAGFELATNT